VEKVAALRGWVIAVSGSGHVAPTYLPATDVNSSHRRAVFRTRSRGLSSVQWSHRINAMTQRSRTSRRSAMKTSYQASPVRTDNVLSILVIAACIGCAGFSAIAQVFAPLAA
jgi:hypothetical protein